VTLPNITVAIRPDLSFIVSGTGILGTTALGSGFLLGPAANAFVPLQGKTMQVSIDRGRTRVTETFDSGKATVRIMDTTGQFNPDNTSSNLYPYVLPLRRFRISAFVNNQSVLLFDGFTTRYTYEHVIGTSTVFITIEAEDAIRILNLATVELVTGAAPNEDTGTRIGKILSQLGVASSVRSIATGDSTLIDDPATIRTGIEAVNQCANAELGAFFISRDGIYTFLSRHDCQELAGGVTVAPLEFNETGGLRFTAIQQGFDDEQTFNNYIVSGDGINELTGSDATSIGEYFTRTYSLSGSLLATDQQAQDMINVLLASRKDPQITIDAIECMPSSMTEAQAATIAQADLLQPITVTKAYASGTITRTLTIQGIRHEITPDRWNTTFALSEPIGGDALVLDSTTQGLLDQDVLSYT
jgi:hypothetical protein